MRTSLLLSRSPHLPHSLLLRYQSTTSNSLTSLLSTHDIPAPHIGSIRILTLYSPHNRNALSTSLINSLSSHLTTLTPPQNNPHNKIRALILSSAISTFSSGADLRERSSMTICQVISFLSLLRSTFTQLSTLPIPSIAAISGPAVGGGCELALACTFRIASASEKVWFALPETRLGIIPGAGGTYRLRGLVGEGRALEMVLTGRRVRVEEAKGWGLVNRVVEGDDVLEGAIAMAREICGGAPVAVGAGLRAVRAGTEKSEEVEYEACLRDGGEDRREALRGFTRKREVRFRGC